MQIEEKANIERARRTCTKRLNTINKRERTTYTWLLLENGNRFTKSIHCILYVHRLASDLLKLKITHQSVYIYTAAIAANRIQRDGILRIQNSETHDISTFFFSSFSLSRSVGCITFMHVNKYHPRKTVIFTRK